jgi:hypothetical protein
VVQVPDGWDGDVLCGTEEVGVLVEVGHAGLEVVKHSPSGLGGGLLLLFHNVEVLRLLDNRKSGHLSVQRLHLRVIFLFNAWLRSASYFRSVQQDILHQPTPSAR